MPRGNDVSRLGLAIASAVAFALLPSVAMAHDRVTVMQYGSFAAGLTHPILGLDHLLAMLSVGIISAQDRSKPEAQTQTDRSALESQTQTTSGRTIWIVPATFVIMMAVGALFGLLAAPDIPIERGIALSVISLGVAIAVGRTVPIALVLIAVAFFGLFHGLAHGVEVPTIADTFWYMGGFLTCTVLIHLAGVLIGLVPQRLAFGRTLLRVIGGVIAVFGVTFF